MKNVAVLLAVLAMSAVSAQSAVVVYEGFDYSGSTINGASGGGELGFADGSTWISSYNNPKLGSSSLSYPTGGTWPATSGGQLYDSQGGKVSRELSDSAKALLDIDAKPPYKEYYISALLQNDARGQVAVELVHGSTVDLQIGITSSGAIFIRDKWNNELSCGTYSTGEAHLVALNVSRRDSQSYFEVRVYAADGSGSYDTYSGIYSHADAVTSLQVDAPAGSTWHVDEIRIGESWEDVTVPEPATMAILGIGGISVLIRRRKK